MRDRPEPAGRGGGRLRHCGRRRGRCGRPRLPSRLWRRAGVRSGLAHLRAVRQQRPVHLPGADLRPGHPRCVAALPDAGTFVQPIGESCAERAADLLSDLLAEPDHLPGRPQPADRQRDGHLQRGGGLGATRSSCSTSPPADGREGEHLAAGGSTAQAVGYLRMSPCATGAELACRDSLGAPSSFRAKSVSPGVYALVIDAYDQLSSGPVEVTVELLPAVTNDTCAAPLDASTDGGTVDRQSLGSGRRSRRHLQHRRRQPRRRLAGDDRPAVGLPRRRHVRWSQTRASTRSSTCAASPCVGGAPLCASTSATAGPEQLRARGLDAGTYFLVVEGSRLGRQRAGGDHQLGHAGGPFPPNDTCARAAGARLLRAPTRCGSRSTPRKARTTTGAPARPSGGGREVVYSFTLATPRTVTVEGRVGRRRARGTR